jgi:hypothetical protein
LAANGPSPTKAKVAAKATVQTAAPKGLQLTTAQQAAYNAAYKATATKIRNNLALQAAATGFRKYRLQAALATVKAYNAAHASAQSAAIAAYATRRTWVQSRLAHQNSALQARIEMDMYNHANLSGRLQYVAAGEKAYAHAAVMRTVDQAQAATYEAAVFKAVSKTAIKASKSVLPAYKPGPNSKAIAAAANTAGLKAAKAVKTRTAPNYGNMYAAMYLAHTRHNQPPPGPVRTDWHGDEVTPNCVITAIANHLMHMKNVKVAERFLTELFEACKPEPTIEEVLWQAWLIGWPGNGVHLKNYRPTATDTAYSMCRVIGYEVLCDDGVTRDHAALSLGEHKVVSWGKVSESCTAIEEAWDLEWES